MQLIQMKDMSSKIYFELDSRKFDFRIVNSEQLLVQVLEFDECFTTLRMCVRTYVCVFVCMSSSFLSTIDFIDMDLSKGVINLSFTILHQILLKS